MVNVTAMRHNTLRPWLWTLPEAAVAALERDIRRCLGLPPIATPSPSDHVTLPAATTAAPTATFVTTVAANGTYHHDPSNHSQTNESSSASSSTSQEETPTATAPEGTPTAQPSYSEEEAEALLVTIARGEIRLEEADGSGEIKIRMQLPHAVAAGAGGGNVTNMATGLATPASLLRLYQRIATNTNWQYVRAYLSSLPTPPPATTTTTTAAPANGSSGGGSGGGGGGTFRSFAAQEGEVLDYDRTRPFCVACAGPNCAANATERPRCATDNNNGFVPYVPPEENACESWYCIMIVFLACAAAGALIAFVAFRASRSAEKRRRGTRRHAIREDLSGAQQKLITRRRK